jgi:hypothetical protein
MKNIRTILLFALLISPGGFAQAPRWEWAKLFGDSNSQQARGIAADKEGNSYVAGGFYGSISFDSITLVSEGSNDIFIVKLDPCG